MKGSVRDQLLVPMSSCILTVFGARSPFTRDSKGKSTTRLVWNDDSNSLSSVAVTWLTGRADIGDFVGYSVVVVGHEGELNRTTEERRED